VQPSWSMQWAPPWPRSGRARRGRGPASHPKSADFALGSCDGPGARSSVRSRVVFPTCALMRTAPQVCDLPHADPPVRRSESASSGALPMSVAGQRPKRSGLAPGPLLFALRVGCLAEDPWALADDPGSASSMIRPCPADHDRAFRAQMASGCVVGRLEYARYERADLRLARSHLDHEAPSAMIRYTA
jgi:hypothetical protein